MDTTRHSIPLRHSLSDKLTTWHAQQPASLPVRPRAPRDPELNKGWWRHEVNPDGQASMLARPIVVVDIRASRQAKRLTQMELARRAGVSQMTVSMAERRLRGVSEAAKSKITQALEATP